MPQPPSPQEVTPERLLQGKNALLEALNWFPQVNPSPGDKIKVILFKDSGKYYTEEEWEVPSIFPSGFTEPAQMFESKDFRRIGNGKVLIPSNHWGFPALL